MAVNTKELKAWKARVTWVNRETPFGPIEFKRNEEGALHEDNGPAHITPTRCVCYKNGRRHGFDIDKWGSITYHWEGVLIPTSWYLKPEEVTLEEVLHHENTEVRYVGMNLYGFDRVLASDKCNVIHKDLDRAGAERVLFTVDGIFSEPVAILKVVNSSSEPSGEYKEVFLTVPPEMKTCQDAVGWTFRKQGEEYQPIVET